jgi:malonyl-CoA O-methyltransferase
MSSARPPERFSLDRRRVRASFERASARYEEAAVLQAQVNNELIDRLSFFKLEPRVILDLGAGTGRGSTALRMSYPQAQVLACDIAEGMLRAHPVNARPIERLCADAAHLPLKNASVDLIFSNLMLQWCDDLDAVFAEIRRVLKPDGLFAFTTFGPDTLVELRTAWAAADDGVHVNLFVDMHNVGDAIVHAGLAEPVLDVERMCVTYPDVKSLMRDLKTIGAHNVAAGRSRGLTGRGRFERVREAYESFRHAGVLPASYEVIYGAAWGTANKPSASMIEGEAYIPLHAIGRRGPSR